MPGRIVDLMLRREAGRPRGAYGRRVHLGVVVAARRAAGRWGRLVLAGARTSEPLAMVEAAELCGAFGLPPDRLVGVMAGSGQRSLAGTDYDENDVEIRGPPDRRDRRGKGGRRGRGGRQRAHSGHRGGPGQPSQKTRRAPS